MARSAVARCRCAASHASKARNAASATVNMRIATSDVVLEWTLRKRRGSGIAQTTSSAGIVATRRSETRVRLSAGRQEDAQVVPLRIPFRILTALADAD